MTQQATDNSGTNVVLGILLAIVVAIGAYFFLQSQENGASRVEPAAGAEAPVAEKGSPSMAPSTNPAQ